MTRVVAHVVFLPEQASGVSQGTQDGRYQRTETKLTIFQRANGKLKLLPLELESFLLVCSRILGFAFALCAC